MSVEGAFERNPHPDVDPQRSQNQEPHPSREGGHTSHDPVGGQAARMWGAGMGRRDGMAGGGGDPGGGGNSEGGGSSRRRGGKRRRGDANAVVPDAEFRSYYGRPVLKRPVWTQDIAYYLFTGGLAASSSMLALVADVRGDATARRNLRITSLTAVGASAYFLVIDLGRPERFYNMLRVAKVTSPMSVGTWILTGFGPLCGAAAVLEGAVLLPQRGVWGLARTVARPAASVAGAGAALFAPLLATYTAVLFADTAVPAWNAPFRELPFVFGGSALAAGAGAGMVLAPVAQAGPARRLAVLGASLELVAGHRMEHEHGLVSEPYRIGRPGRFLRAARALTVAGALGAVLGRRSRVVSAAAGACLLTGSFLTRVAVFEAGITSAEDPKYVVVPQRERADARAAAAAAAVPA